METAPSESAPTPPAQPSVESLQALRIMQEARLANVTEQVLSEIPEEEHDSETTTQAVQATQLEARLGFYDMAEQYAQGYIDPEQEPEKYKTLAQLARSVSVDQMTDDQWRLGDTDEDNKHSSPDTTSGKAIAVGVIEEITKVAPTPLEARGITEPEIIDGERNLEEARNALAILSVQARRLRNKPELSTADNLVLQQYEAARATHNDARKAIWDAWNNKLQEQGADGPLLSREITDSVVEEFQKLTRAEMKILDEDFASDKSMKKVKESVVASFRPYEEWLRTTLRTDAVVNLTPEDLLVYSNARLDDILDWQTERAPESKKRSLAKFSGALSLTKTVSR